MDRALWDKLRALRERTGAGLSDCKRALADARGDLDDAAELLPFYPHVNVERFLFPAQVCGTVSADGRAAVLVEIGAPHRLRDHAEALAPFIEGVVAAAGGAPLGSDLMDEALGDGTIGAAAAALSERIGLSVGVRRWTRIELAPGEHGRCAVYVQPSRRELGAVVAVTAENAAIAAHDATRRFTAELADRISGWRPLAISRAGLDPRLVDEERAQYAQHVPWLLKEGLTQEEAEEHGKRWLDRWVEKRVLLERPWGWRTVPWPIEEQRQAASAEAGGALRIARFVWFERGAGMADAST